MNEELLENITVLRAVFPFAPNYDFAHLVQYLGNAYIGGIAERLQIDEPGIEFPEMYEEGTIDF